MIWFVLALGALVLGAISFFMGKAHAKKATIRNQQEAARGARFVGIALLVLGVFVIGLNSFTQVPARNVGIVNAFGRAESSLDNGIHLVKPWASIEIVDATVQNINLKADMGLWAQNICTTITVRLANQTTACIDGTLQWNIEQGGNANKLWQSYRGTNDNVVANVGKNMVERELQRAANNAFETYNPLAILPSSEGATGTAPETTVNLSKRIEADMKRSVDPGVIVDRLLISVVHFDATTQQKLNGFAQAVADTQIATQQKLTAEQQRLANEELSRSAASSDPGVQFQNCINLIRELAAKGVLKELPPAFTCGGQSPAQVLLQAGSR